MRFGKGQSLDENDVIFRFISDVTGNNKEWIFFKLIALEGGRGKNSKHTLEQHSLL